MNFVQVVSLICACVGIGVQNLVVFSACHKANKRYKMRLEKISKYDDYLINKECFLPETSLDDESEALSRELVQVIYPFIEEILEYVGDENTQLLYKNLKTVDINPMRLLLDKKSIELYLSSDGLYSPRKNIIWFKTISDLRHELLHLASTYYDKEKNITECGFMQINYEDDAEIGRGLNEGYTDLLNSRIDIYEQGKASFLIIIVRLIELFFDDCKSMEKYYFGHDLPGFIHYMEQFIPRDRIINLIIRLDKINNFYEYGVPVFIMLEVINIEKELYGYLVKSNLGSDRVAAFESIIGEHKLSSMAFRREKMRLVKDNLTVDEAVNKDFDTERKMTA